MKRVVLYALGFAWLMLALVGHADAASFVMTYRGIIDSGYDATEPLGPNPRGFLLDRPETDLTGLSLLVWVEIETGADTLFSTDGTTTVLRGGSDYGVASIVKSAYIEIAGARDYFTGEKNSRIHMTSSPNGQSFTIYLSQPGSGSLTDDKSLLLSAGTGPGYQLPPWTFDRPFTFTPLPNGGSSAYFHDIRYGNAPGGYNSVTIGGSGNGTVSLLPVPEPATWLMMILGFGGMGYAIRRSRNPAARVEFA